MDELREKLAALSPEKRALLRARLKPKSVIAPGADQSRGPLTPEQERLWFLDQKDGPSAMYNVPLLLRLSGALDVQRLELALRAVMTRHAALRTRICAEGGEPMMRVDEDAKLKLLVLEGGESAAREHAREPFYLNDDKLVRVVLFKSDDQEHVLLLNLHHVITDGWSNAILQRDLIEAYERGALEKTSGPSYLDYARWRRGRLAGEDVGRALEWWQTQLNGVQPGYALLPDRQPKERSVAPAANYGFEIGPVLSQAVRRAARAQNTTVFSFLLAAFAAVSARYTGDAERVIASPVANRTLPELEDVVGFFVNMIALRLRVDDATTWIDYLRQTSAVVIESLEQQEAPLERVLELLPHLRGGADCPLLRTVFSLEKSSGPLSTGALRLSSVPMDGDTAKFDFMLMVQDAPEGMRGHLEFDAGCYEMAMAAGFAESFCKFLKAVSDEPATVLGKIQLRNALLPVPALQQTESVVTWFRNHACSRNKALVVSGGRHDGAEMTFAELDGASDRLAGALQAVGIVHGDAVGVCFSRNTDLIVALLAILKCGAVYVPLDPEYPEERLRLMVCTAKVKRILTEFDTRFEGMGIEVNGLTAHEFRPVEVSGEDAAYIMFTSGSTGEPKGVRIPHRGIVRLVQGQTYANFSSERRWLHISSISFDASTLEIWAPLLHGGACILCADAHIDGAAIAHAVRAHGADSAWITASLFNHLVDHDAESLRGLAQILTGGEALSVAHVRRAQSVLPGVDLVNGYGPTENTTFTCCHRISEPVSEDASTIPIGVPICGTTVHVLDERLRPVPPGAMGELYTGGAGLAIEYEGREDLTRERFVCLENGERVYRTGDLVRSRVDGTIEFLGRRDGQIKVRGFRIEAAEVEAALRTVPGVRAAAAAANDEGQLIGYVVSEGEVAEMARTLLLRKLPSYMIPNRVVRVDNLPRTRNGKLDVLSLRSVSCGVSRTAPRTQAQKFLADIWCEFLGVKEAFLEDDFFASGGHSLLALRMFAAMEKRLGRRLPLAVLFESPTLGALASRLENEDTPQCVVRMQDGAGPIPFFCVHAGDGGILFYRELAAELAGVCAIYGVEASWLAGGHAEQCSIEEVAAEYVGRIRKVQPHGPYRLGGFSFGGVVAYEMARQLQHAGETTELVVLFDTFNPAHPPQRLTFGQRMRRNYQAAADRGWLSMAAYFVSRAWGKVVANFFKHREHARRMAADVMEHAGQNVPVDYQVIQAREAHIRAMWNYRPAAYSGKVVLYAAEEPLEGWHYPQDRGWGEWVQGELEVIETPGSHPTILQQPQVKVLARSLRERLEAQPVGAVSPS